ncbi:MAG: hypothetical protein GY739_19500, partial [Mesoflavibacter sp.]|nr:hypothetical protein [Mesoflavibacter sp.]
SPDDEPEHLPTVESTKYRCLTTSDKDVPLKAVIVQLPYANCYSKPNTSSSKVKKLKFFSFYFIFDMNDSFLKVGVDSFSSKTIGWVKKDVKIKELRLSQINT